MDKISSSNKSAILIAASYCVFGVLWIFLSDYAVETLAQSTHQLTVLQTYKGWFFIFVTTMLLYLLSKRLFQSADDEVQAHRKTTQKLRRNTALLDRIISASPDAVYIKDMQGRYLLFNGGAERVTGKKRSEVIGKTDNEVFSPENAQKIRARDRGILKEGKVVNEEEELFIEGKRRFFWLTKGPVYDEQGEPFGLFGIAREMTRQKMYEQTLAKAKERYYNLAHYDTLTKLPNRLDVLEVLRKKCDAGDPFALFLLDLDAFKVINDSYGHRFGDLLLVQVGDLLQQVFGTEENVFRMGGDEFAMIVNSSDRVLLQELIDRFTQRMDQPVQIEEVDVYITASIGVALYDEDAKDVDGLLQNSDAALSNAKKIGKNTFSFYRYSFTESAQQHAQIASRLKMALQNGELQLHYQGQYDTQTRQPVGAEALMRWNREGETVSPGVFIPVAEESGLIHELGIFTLYEGFSTAATLAQRGRLRGKIALNVSARQLGHREFVKTMERIADNTKCDPAHIELEITETSILNNPRVTTEILHRLRQNGYSIAMDDFGTGYSSLSYLKDLPIDKLKIDRSFIQNIHTEPKNQSIVRTMLYMAKELGIVTLAEGVETKEELEFLREQGVDMIQGFYYHRPAPKEALERLFA